MALAMQTHIVRIGNSQGIRIPKPMLEQAGIGDRVELEVRDGEIAIRPARRARAAWQERFAAMAEAGDDQLLDDGQPAATAWDEQDWER